MRTETLKVTYVAFPDGRVIWFKDGTQEYITRCLGVWQAALPEGMVQEYGDAGVSMMAGEIVMLVRDYDRIRAESNFPFPEAAPVMPIDNSAAPSPPLDG